jgi:hypothetical protein
MEANLKGISPGGLDPDMAQDLTWLQLDVSSKQDAFVSLSSLMSPICVVDKTTCVLKYALTTPIQGETAALEKGKLYYSTIDKKFFYFLPNLKNDVPYMFAITATDERTGTESPTFSFPAEGKRQNSVDDVPPGLATVNSAAIGGTDVLFTVAPITYNIDGSPLDPGAITNFKIYCFESVASDTFTLSPDKAMYAMGYTPLVEPIQFSRPVSDFVSACGAGKNVRFVVAGVKKINNLEVDYKGTISSSAFSSQEVALPVS